LKPWQQQEWCIPAVGADFVAPMEDVLDLYAAPYDPAYPVVCFDESPKQLVAEVRTPIAVEPGAPARYDTEYERNGVRDVMMICEPKRGWREVLLTERRTKIDFAHMMKHIVECYPEATTIRLVIDNLNTHKPASLYEASFRPKRRGLSPGSSNSTTPRNMAVGSTSPKLSWPSSPPCACRNVFPTKPLYGAISMPTSASAMPRPSRSSGNSPHKIPDASSLVSILAFQFQVD